MVMKKWCHKLIQSRQEFLLHAALNPDPDLTKSSTLSNNKQYNWKRRIFGLCLFLMFRVLIGRCTLERDVALSWQLLTLTYLQLWTCQPRKYTKTKHWLWETNHRIFCSKLVQKVFLSTWPWTLTAQGEYQAMHCSICSVVKSCSRWWTTAGRKLSEARKPWLQTLRFWSSLVCCQEPKVTMVNIWAPPFAFSATVST